MVVDKTSEVNRIENRFCAPSGVGWQTVRMIGKPECSLVLFPAALEISRHAAPSDYRIKPEEHVPLHGVNKSNDIEIMLTAWVA